jgi:hypothetical protein
MDRYRIANETEAEDRAEDQSSSIADKAILEALEMMRFLSIRQIAKMTFTLPPAVLHLMRKSLHFVLKRLHDVAHTFLDLKSRFRSLCQKSY